MAVIFAPITETLLFQMLPWFALKRIHTVKRHRIIAVVISGLVFGLLHTYSVMYMISASFIGMIMMWGYIVRLRKNAFWNIVLFHAFWNALMIVMYFITDSNLES